MESKDLNDNEILNKILEKVTKLESKFEEFEENFEFELETLDSLNRFEAEDSSFKKMKKEEFLKELENW